jgi:hypothetical protein
MKPKKQLTEAESDKIAKDIGFIKQSIEKAKKRLKQLKQNKHI